MEDRFLDEHCWNYYLEEITEKISDEAVIENVNYNPLIKKVKFNNPATIVWFIDGTKFVSVCSDNDKFDKHIGISVAVAKKYLGGFNEIDKLVEEYSDDIVVDTVRTRDINFNIGDKVRIRGWCDIKDEFGVLRSGEIECQGVFTNKMKILQGEEFVIDRINDLNIVYGHNFYWHIYTDMIEKVK